MWLRNVAPEKAAELPTLAEFIHAQTDHPIYHWLAAGSLCAPTGRPVGGDLRSDRCRHYETLKRIYGDEKIHAWMHDCMKYG